MSILEDMPVLLIGCWDLVLKKAVPRTNPSKRRKKSTEFFYSVSYLLSIYLAVTRLVLLYTDWL